MSRLPLLSKAARRKLDTKWSSQEAGYGMLAATPGPPVDDINSKRRLNVVHRYNYKNIINFSSFLKFITVFERQNYRR